MYTSLFRSSVGDEDELEMIIRRSSVNNISALLHTTGESSYLSNKNETQSFLRSRPVSFRHPSNSKSLKKNPETNPLMSNKGFSNFKEGTDYMDASWCSRRVTQQNSLCSHNNHSNAALSPLENQFKSVFNISRKEQERQIEEDKEDDKNEGYSERLASMGLLLPVKKKKVCTNFILINLIK